MQNDSPQVRSLARLEWGQMFGLLVAGAVIGVALFGIALGLFDSIRDSLGLVGSSAVSLAMLLVVIAALVTILACWLLSFLMVSLAQSAPPAVEHEQLPKPAQSFADDDRTVKQLPVRQAARPR